MTKSLTVSFSRRTVLHGVSLYTQDDSEGLLWELFAVESCIHEVFNYCLGSFSWFVPAFSTVPTYECQNDTLKWTTFTSFQIPTCLIFIIIFLLHSTLQNLCSWKCLSLTHWQTSSAPVYVPVRQGDVSCFCCDASPDESSEDLGYHLTQTFSDRFGALIFICFNWFNELLETIIMPSGLNKTRISNQCSRIVFGSGARLMVICN
jgi:hypothetical protein